MKKSVAGLVCTECAKTVTDDPGLAISSFADNRFVSARSWRPSPEHQPDVLVCGACAAEIVRLHFAQTDKRQRSSAAGLVCTECAKTVTDDSGLAISSFEDNLFPAGHEPDMAVCGTCAVWVVRLHFARTNRWWGTMAIIHAAQTFPAPSVARGGPMLIGDVDEAVERLEWLAAHPDDEYPRSAPVIALCRRIFECWPRHRPVPFFCPDGDGVMNIDDDDRSASIRVRPASVALVTWDWATDAPSEQYTSLDAATLRRVLPVWLDVMDSAESFTDWHERQPKPDRV